MQAYTHLVTFMSFVLRRSSCDEGSQLHSRRQPEFHVEMVIISTRLHSARLQPHRGLVRGSLTLSRRVRGFEVISLPMLCLIPRYELPETRS
jgi:hypothetical protein